MHDSPLNFPIVVLKVEQLIALKRHRITASYLNARELDYFEFDTV
jgi:hypothetical protein